MRYEEFNRKKKVCNQSGSFNRKFYFIFILNEELTCGPQTPHACSQSRQVGPVILLKMQEECPY